MSRTRVVAGGIVTGVVALLATAAPASAHDQLISSDPAAGSVLESAPEQITLTYSDDLLDLGATVIVADADGHDWAAAEPVLDGTQVQVPLDAEMPDAGYEVRWRVVSADGHPISGVVGFVVGDGTPLERGTPPDAGGPAEAAAPVDAEQGGPAQGSTAQGEAAASSSDDGPTRALLVGAGGALLALAVLFLLTRSRRRATAAGLDVAPADAPDAAPSDSPERH
jgi:methionine-rich copper-binding protein CopC